MKENVYFIYIYIYIYIIYIIYLYIYKYKYIYIYIYIASVRLEHSLWRGPLMTTHIYIYKIPSQDQLVLSAANSFKLKT